MPSSDHSTGSIDPLLRPRPREEHQLLPSLYVGHRRRLRGLAAAVTFDQSAADDIVQEPFAGLTAQVDRVKNPIAYLQRSVINLGINAVRRRERFGRLPERRLEHTSMPEFDEMWDAIGRLPPLQRAVVVLRFYEDQSQQQIADTLDMPVGSVKSNLHRALTTLRKASGHPGPNPDLSSRHSVPLPLKSTNLVGFSPGGFRPVGFRPVGFQRGLSR